MPDASPLSSLLHRLTLSPTQVCKMTAEEESWYNDKRYWQ